MTTLARARGHLFATQASYEPALPFQKLTKRAMRKKPVRLVMPRLDDQPKIVMPIKPKVGSWLERLTRRIGLSPADIRRIGCGK